MFWGHLILTDKTANLQHWSYFYNWFVVPRIARRWWLVLYTDKHCLVISYISTLEQILVNKRLGTVDLQGRSLGCPQASRSAFQQL